MDTKDSSFLYPHLPDHDDHSPHAGSPPKWSDLERLEGNQGGFNEGGLYLEKSTGEKWYLKFPDGYYGSAHDRNLANNEALASKLYRACKVRSPETWAIQTDQGPAIASRWVHGLRRDQKGLPEGKYTDDVAHGIAADAWLANWDQVGIGSAHPYGNMPIKDGRVVRIDPGGALLYRGTGGPKGKYFTDDVTELHHFQHGENQRQRSVYRHVKPDQIADSILRVLNVTHSEIENLVRKYGPGDDHEKESLIEKLKKRQQSLASQYSQITGKKPPLGGSEKTSHLMVYDYLLKIANDLNTYHNDILYAKVLFSRAEKFFDYIKDEEPSDDLEAAIDELVAYWLNESPMEAVTLPLGHFYDVPDLVDLIVEKVTSPKTVIEVLSALMSKKVIVLDDLRTQHEIGNIEQVFDDLDVKDRQPMLEKHSWLEKFVGID